MRTTWWGLAALVAVAVASGCDARSLDTIPDAGMPLTTEYRWGDVAIHVSPTGMTIGGMMTLLITDHANPPTLSTSLSYAGSIPRQEGAHVLSRHGCAGDPSLYALEIYSCAQTPSGELAIGCVAVTFHNSGDISGTFIHPTGTRCDVRGGRADIVLPQPTWMAGVGPEAASGTFVLDCKAVDGRDVVLDATFSLPQSASILTC